MMRLRERGCGAGAPSHNCQHGLIQRGGGVTYCMLLPPKASSNAPTGPAPMLDGSNQGVGGPADHVCAELERLLASPDLDLFLHACASSCATSSKRRCPGAPDRIRGLIRSA